jgi:hypothetical protein
MLRQHVRARTSFADASAEAPAADPGVRHSAARVVVRALRLIVAPVALASAALAGLLFAVLLPICGIATISEGIARASWRFVRESFARAPHAPARRI